MRTLMAGILAGFVVGACSSSSASSAIDAGGDLGVADHDGGSAAQVPVDDGGVACSAPPAGATITLDTATTRINQGVHAGTGSISGTVTLSAPFPHATGIAIGISYSFDGAPENVKLGFGDTSATGQLPAGATSFTYVMDHFESGYVQIWAVVDVNSNSSLDEGDMGGFYAGSVTAPIDKGESSRVLTMGTTARCNYDFGIAPLLCLKKYGEACASDADCRGTFFQCNSIGGAANKVGACNATTKVCQEAANPCVSNNSPTKTEASCTGDVPH